MTPSPEGPAATAAHSRDPSRAQPAPVAAGVARPPTGIRKAWIALRSAVYLLLLALTVAPYSIFSLLCIVTPHPLRYWLITGWPKTALWLARVVCGIRYEVTGWENLPDGPAVLLPKHQSAWETIWLIASMPRPSSFVYKRELHRIPFFGWGIATLGMISIDRGRGTDAFEQVVEQGQKRLAEGWYVIIFPEGTRTAPGTHTRYKTGAARLAVRAGVPAVPIALNSGELWPRKAFLKIPGTITVSIGPPVDTRGRSAGEVARMTERWIETEMHRIAPHRYPQESAAGNG